MHYDLIAFDLDGTLVDSACEIAEGRTGRSTPMASRSVPPRRSRWVFGLQRIGRVLHKSFMRLSRAAVQLQQKYRGVQA